jgi:pimeloyl-ACP methyl ester carboxylesterase/prenyltransferase beta subunit
MRRILFGIAVCLLCGRPADVSAQTPADMAQTAAWLAEFQNSDGGFTPIAGGASTLGATSSAIRSLKYVGGSIRDVPGCIGFVKSCRDAASGGFAQIPGGKTDVSTTAIGLMALAELKVADDASTQAAIGYFSKNVKSFEEIRIAVAGLEAVEAKSPDFPAWIQQVEADRKPDGTWGEGAGRSRATGGAAVALLRMGVELEKKATVLAGLREGQRPDGGWADGDKPSDLGSSYRIMRCFFMLKEKPDDLDGLLRFVARHRQADGGYGQGASAPSDLSSTYYATIMTRWARLLSGEPALVETAGFRPLVRNQLDPDWQTGTPFWSVHNGTVLGASPGLKQNEFLIHSGNFRNFVLKLTFRLEGNETSNSGIQFRSRPVAGGEMSGYQADIGQDYWGCLYDESRRNNVLARPSARALATLRKDDWNQYGIRAMGDHITLSLNGVTAVDYHELDPNIPQDGQIALQLHAGQPLNVQFKDIYIQPLPDVTSDPRPTQGFHLRALKTPRGDRKYVVYFPANAENSGGIWGGPVILFLHGAGERGKDGIAPTQVGLGPAILNQQPSFPFIVVFPQAEKTWSADSEDAAAALAALDDVVARFTPKRGDASPHPVVLTGLSMGGRGAWEIAAAHPGRFKAVVPICGPAKPEVVPALKEVPIWAFVGDEDRKETVLGMRELVRLLEEAGATPRYTEYRGVGHNSWDRTYADPKLYQWMVNRPFR